MSCPPTGARRRRLGRALAFAVIGLLVLLASGGFIYWQKTRFPARSEALAGTPIELRVQDGVSGRELRAIRGGLRAMQRYMERSLGVGVHEHVEARVARKNSCRPFESSAGGALMGEGDKGFLCVDTSSLAWQYLVRTDFVAATAISAHEYVHVLQAELGCLQPGEYRWLVEGMATHLAWRALVSAGHASEARVVREIRDDRPLSPTVGLLSGYERGDGRDQEYALWHLAVRRLLRRAMSSGSASRSRPETALVRFCNLVGHGRRWHAAFEHSFGLPVERFYANFQSDRRRGALIYR